MAGTFRVAPNAAEVEKHIIGAMMLDRESIGEVGKILKPEDFYLERHGLIFRACQALTLAHKEIDLISLSDQLKRSNHFDMAGGDAYLMEISSEVVSSANVGQHAGII